MVGVESHFGCKLFCPGNGDSWRGMKMNFSLRWFDCSNIAVDGGRSHNTVDRQAGEH